jgi:hypothetical protein
MQLKPKLEAEYARYVADNDDPYSAAVVRFSEAWANAMEQEIANGRTIAECAKATSHAANTEGITGFMYGCAAAALAQFWVHGEELRRWHNIDTQIGTEGEKANASGGVLNPALMTIGDASGQP